MPSVGLTRHGPYSRILPVGMPGGDAKSRGLARYAARRAAFSAQPAWCTITGEPGFRARWLRDRVTRAGQNQSAQPGAQYRAAEGMRFMKKKLLLFAAVTMAGTLFTSCVGNALIWFFAGAGGLFAAP